MEEWMLGPEEEPDGVGAVVGSIAWYSLCCGSMFVSKEVREGSRRLISMSRSRSRSRLGSMGELNHSSEEGEDEEAYCWSHSGRSICMSAGML